MGKLDTAAAMAKPKMCAVYVHPIGRRLRLGARLRTGTLGPKVYDVDPYDGSLDTEAYGGKFAVNANAELLFPPWLKRQQKYSHELVC